MRWIVKIFGLLVKKNKISNFDNQLVVSALKANKLKQSERYKVLSDGRTLEQTIIEGYYSQIERQKNSKNPKFHRTEKEEELSFSFSQKYDDKLKPYEEKIYDADESLKKYSKRKDFTKEEKVFIEKQCNEEIIAYKKLKEFCYKTKGGRIYFQDMWEYCHYEVEDCFEFIKPALDLLEKINQQ